MTRIALVSYLNTRPFMDGISAAFSPEEISLELLPPADCAAAMRDGRCEVALLPVGSLLDFTGLELMNTFCIGAEGAVDSVFLFSRVPASEVTHLILDPHSRTSNGLARILFRDHWHADPVLLQTGARGLDKVEGTTAAVLIGDHAYAERHNFPYVYDLAAEWKSHTGLPFVFAVWVYQPELVDQALITRIEAALANGWADRNKSALRWGGQYGYSDADAQEYLCERIKYNFDSAKHSAMERYFAALSDLSSVDFVIPAAKA